MQVTETLNSGLKREIKVTVPAADMESKLLARLNDAKSKVRLNGFRPGRVPVQHLRKMYGKSLMAEVVNEIVTDSAQSILSERGEKAATQPEVQMTEDEKEAEKILAGNADFEFSLAYEVVPPIEIKDYSGIALTRPVYDVPAEDIEEQVKRVAESARTYADKDGAADTGDRVTIDFVGKIDGEAFEGGSAEGQQVVLGSNQFLPGFEDQLIGAAAGEERKVEVTFPADYGAANLAGKDAAFDVTVKAVAKADALEVNDELAQKLGIESADRLREIVRGQIEGQFGAVTRQKVKRQLLDALDKEYVFEAPSKLIDAEFENIWRQVTGELEQAGKTFADEDTTEEKAREEYRRLAERRVRLGLVLAEIGAKANVQVTDDELQRALMEFIRQAPPDQQRELFEAYRKNPELLANFRAPLFEEKVVDHLVGAAAVTDKKVSKEELLAEEQDEDAKPAETAADEKAAETAAGEKAAETAAGDKAAKPKKPAAKKASPKSPGAEAQTAAEEDPAEGGQPTE